MSILQNTIFDMNNVMIAIGRVSFHIGHSPSKSSVNKYKLTQR